LSGRVVINYKTGIDRYSGLFEFCREEIGCFKNPTKGYYTYTGKSEEVFKFRRTNNSPELWETMFDDGLRDELENFVAFGIDIDSLEENKKSSKSKKEIKKTEKSTDK